MPYGVVKVWHGNKGWGFITSDQGDDCFVHITALKQSGLSDGLAAGDRVAFVYERDHKNGKLQATRVRLDYSDR